MKQQLESILAEFKAPGSVRAVRTGPVVQTMLVELGAGVRVKKVAALEDDIALRLGVDSVRIVPNVPDVPYLGVEVPRADPEVVPWRLTSSNATLPLALGVDTMGQWVTVDLAKAPHLLVAGSTGSGKSVAVHTMILSLLGSGKSVGFVLIDPKQLEFRCYENHFALATPVVTDPMDATRVLNQLVREMEARYKLLAKHGVRDIGEYRARGGKMGYFVVIIDEWADLYSMQGKGIELPVVRLAQKARACGIHMVLATQRPEAKVLPGLVKSNFPARIALRTTTMVDSRVVLDENGAERLLGRGDMLVKGFGLDRPTRVHGAYVDPSAYLT